MRFIGCEIDERIAARAREAIRTQSTDARGIGGAGAGKGERGADRGIDPARLPHPGDSPGSAARVYLEMGLRPIPLWSVDPESGVCECSRGAQCGEAGRHPRVKAWRDARASAGEVKAWWEKWPRAGVGLVMGGEARIVAVVVEGERGRESLSGLEEAHGALPRTLVSRAGKDGGEVRVFVAPLHFDLAAMRNGAGRISPEVEVRADGGFVVVAPTVERGGSVYAWGERVAVAELPGWVFGLASGAGSANVAARRVLPVRSARGASATPETWEGNPLRGFLEAECFVDLDRTHWPEVWVTRAALREAFTRWCETKKIGEVMGAQAFTKHLREMGLNPNARRWVAGTAVRAWEGIRMRR